MSKIRASHILCKTQPEAIEIVEMLNSGERFEQLAKERSICPSGKRGGDLGSFGRGMMVKKFEQSAYNLKNGETTSAPVKTQFGYHIIKRTG